MKTRFGKKRPVKLLENGNENLVPSPLFLEPTVWDCIDSVSVVSRSLWIRRAIKSALKAAGIKVERFSAVNWNE